MSNRVILWRMNHILNHNNGAKYRIQCDLKKLKVLNDLNNYESS